ncbi:P-loop containing nucleoside triphosphate hydrolase protein [Ilyonectria sp. MPI-CAGE-AT-0026]|nr:P-loop containing nucleoside triphosphate hydrolase protein [Ilyonectria sp. MPI-CAGE-AT-0026]
MDPERVETAQSQIDSFAIVCYNHPVGELWRLECIGINNQDLRDYLFRLFEDYPAVDCTSTELRFTQPFVPFLHLWAKFVDLVESVTEPVLRENLDILQHILKKQLKEAFKAYEVLQETACVNFDQLPIAFTPGEIILNKKDGVISAALLKEIERVTSDDEKDACYRFRVNQLDWDGMNCGVRESTFEIAEFEGALPLGDMDVLPLKSHPRHEVVKERLIARGRRFEKLRRERLMIYNAHGREMIVNERVIIDAKSFYEDARGLRASLKPLSDLEPENAIRKPIIPARATFRELVEGPATFCRGQGRPYTPEKRKTPDYSPLTDDQCLLAVPTVFGFGLDTKKWFKLSVSHLQEISWNSDAMDKLVIKESDKDLVLSHVCAAAQTPKFGEEKGQGSMILLAGPPGTGKTFTAETASEEVKRPLYKLSVSDLGTNAADVESNLTRVLRRCAKWAAILSIDEADVFLEVRSAHSLERNKIVSVFLRRLEYYSGAMILTANRYFTIDKAFESHIDLALPFKEPDAAARAKIWRNFVNRSVAASALGDGDLAPLAKVPLNGRHIQSAFKTACVLAARRRVPLNIEHLQTAVEARHRAARLLGGGGV